MDPNTELRELRDARCYATQSLQELEDVRVSENREFTSAEQRDYQRYKSDIDRYDNQLTQFARRHGITYGMGEDRGPPPFKMDWREQRKYSLVKFLLARLHPEDRKLQDAAGFELEVAAEIQSKYQGAARGAFIPRAVLGGERRTMIAADGGTGGYFVGDQLFSDDLIGQLRSAAILPRLGVTRFDGLQGNVLIPKQTGAGTAYWMEGEEDDVTKSNQSIGQVTLRPHHIGAHTRYSKQLLMQNSVGIEEFIRNDLARIVDIEMDRVSLYGSGVGGQPGGLGNNADLNDPTDFAAATPTWAECMAMVAETALDNALPGWGGGEDDKLTGSVAWVTDGQTAANLMAKAKDAGSGTFVMELADGVPRIGPWPVAISNTVTTGDVWFGDWSQMVWGTWGDVDIIVNPFTQDTSGVVRLTLHAFADTAVRNGQAFCRNNDG